MFSYCLRLYFFPNAKGSHQTGWVFALLCFTLWHTTIGVSPPLTEATQVLRGRSIIIALRDTCAVFLPWKTFSQWGYRSYLGFYPGLRYLAVIAGSPCGRARIFSMARKSQLVRTWPRPVAPSRKYSDDWYLVFRVQEILVLFTFCHIEY